MQIISEIIRHTKKLNLIENHAKLKINIDLNLVRSNYNYHIIATIIISLSIYREAQLKLAKNLFASS